MSKRVLRLAALGAVAAFGPASIFACASDDDHVPATSAADASTLDAFVAALDGASKADASSADVTTADARRSDPFAGVWSGAQAGEVFVFSNDNGCSAWSGTVDAAACDECLGTYAIVDAGVATLTIRCVPVGACSVSPAHTNVGTLTLDGGAITYTYNYGSGTGVFNGNLVDAQAPSNVCALVDAGTD